MTTVRLKVLTLNCWGVFVPLACKDRLERMKEIGKELSVGNYDIVFLQEVWSKSDYQLLCQYILPAMPYTHYYYSGIIGSGLCLFSKFKIIETSQFRFSLNGYAHRLMCGDWMADKSVGFAKILLEPGSIKLNAYTTHLHAQYSEDNTYHAYEEHRCLQSFELAKFLRDTSCSCDCVVFGGDFNITPNQVGYNLITSIGNVQDSWRVQKNEEKAANEEATCCRSDNIYWSKSSDLPVRIDYIFHRNNAGCEMECVDCDLAMGKVPGQKFNFSDHDGVVAEFTIKKNLTGHSYSADHKQTIPHLERAMKTLEDGSKRVKTMQVLWMSLSLALLLAYSYHLTSQYSWQQTLQQNHCAGLNQADQLHHGVEQGVRLKLQEAKDRFGDSEQKGEILTSCLDGFKYQKIYFAVVEIVKMLVTVLIVFSVVHSCLVLSRERITIKSTITDMMNMINFYKDIAG